MFEELLNCTPEDLQEKAERISMTVDEENAETFIRTLFSRVTELSDEQEKELHKLGRKVRKKFHMKPIH
ncbi:MAG: hypothetical protein Q4F95_09625 [Oscillospiraceae bacterium]|nr:hypothetical protein [Oscillospiraceae bacterium]